MLTRIIQGRSATLSHAFTVDGVATDPTPDSTLVSITRADGTPLVVNAATIDGGVGVATHTITPALTQLLDRLSVTWIATFGGNEQTFVDTVEVAGGELFTIAQLRAMSNQLANVTNYPTSGLTAVRTRVEQAIEKRIGYALVPRYERARPAAGATIRLKPYIRAFRSGVSAGTALTSTDLAALEPVSDTGYVTGYTWSYPATIAYEHGLDGGDEEATQAALTLAKVWLLPTGLDDRAASFTSVEGGTYSLTTPGIRGSTFGIGLVDEFVQANRLIAVA